MTDSFGPDGQGDWPSGPPAGFGIWPRTATDSHCHQVREGDTIPCPERPSEPHVDADGRVWGYANDYADEPAEGCA